MLYPPESIPFDSSASSWARAGTERKSVTINTIKIAKGMECTPWRLFMALLLFPSEASFRTCVPSPKSKSISSRLLFEEERIEVGAVHLRVAQHARLEEAGLVVERRSPRRAAETRRRVALQAQQVDVAQLQHVRIRPAVHHMARLASVDLHRLVFENKRPLLVRVTRKANRVLRGRRP